jgi:hypothetical protein
MALCAGKMGRGVLVRGYGCCNFIGGAGGKGEAFRELSCAWGDRFEGRWVGREEQRYVAEFGNTGPGEGFIPGRDGSGEGGSARSGSAKASEWPL